MLADELRPLFIFDGLTNAQVADLAAVGEKVAFDEHEELFKEGDPADFWWVLLDGKVQIVRRAGRSEPVVMTVMENPGQWAGGFQAWAEASYLATGRGEVAGHMFRVPSRELGRLASDWTPFGVHMIKGFFQTVRSMDTLSRQREELIKLGEMSAQLAHEINNPASAAGAIGRHAQRHVRLDAFVPGAALRAVAVLRAVRCDRRAAERSRSVGGA